MGLSVSYTSEVDFRNETSDDCIVFYLFVKAETFANYAAKTAHGQLDEMILRVGGVDGFYSEWSPSISTRNVKVLAPGDEHKIALPPDHQLEPPRLGHVREAELHINRRLAFVQPTPKPEAGDIQRAEPEAVEETKRVTPGVEETKRVTPGMQAPAAVDPQMLQMLRSLRRAAWFAVWILALIFIVILLRR